MGMPLYYKASDRRQHTVTPIGASENRGAGKSTVTPLGKVGFVTEPNYGLTSFRDANGNVVPDEFEEDEEDVEDEEEDIEEEEEMTQGTSTVTPMVKPSGAIGEGATVPAEQVTVESTVTPAPKRVVRKKTTSVPGGDTPEAQH